MKIKNMLCSFTHFFYRLFIKIVLPLIVQMEYTNEEESSKHSNIESQTENNHLNAVLTVLLEMLRKHTTNRLEFQQQQGFSLIAYLLKYISPVHINQQTVDLIFDMEAALSTGEVWADLIKNLLLDFDLWIYIKFDVQMHLISKLGELFRDQHSKMRELFGLQQITDILRTYYWYTREERSAATEPKFHSKTKEEQGQRPLSGEIEAIRDTIIKEFLIYTFKNYESSFNPPDIGALVSFLFDCTDDQQVVEILSLVLSNYQTFHPEMQRYLISHSGWTGLVAKIEECSDKVCFKSNISD
jgi:hypothetical protein